MEVQEEILQQLGEVEVRHGVRIPIAVESGSRAWGFASPDSDYDCRFMYIHPKEWYLSVFEGRDTIEITPDAVFDVGGWEIRKVIQHLVKSNAVMLEWLASPLIYRMNEGLREELQKLGQTFFNPTATCWHYLNMARKALGEIEATDSAKIKKYCYVLRPLASARFICTHRAIPYMEYQKNLAKIHVPDSIRSEIIALLKEKETALEGFLLPKNEKLLAYFHEESLWVEQQIADFPGRKVLDLEIANQTFRKIIEMVNTDESY